MSRFSVSFIVPAYNEEALIGATLKAIAGAAAACAPWMAGSEILVVNDDSTDRTAGIAREHGATVVDVQKRQIAAVRNAGAKVATGQVLIFVDADTLINPTVLAGALAHLRRGAVGGGAVVRFDSQVPLAAHAFTWLFMHSFIAMRWAAGCFIFCRREAFGATGGFDERFYASEEIWLSEALKRQGRFFVIRDPVTTSGRKIRMHGFVSLLAQMMWMGVRGPTAVQQREGLDLWYDGKRE